MPIADCRTNGGVKQRPEPSARTQCIRPKADLRTFGILSSAIGLLLAGCAVGPDYKPPKTETPAGWDGTTVVAPAQTSHATTEPVKISEWWNVLNDAKLTALVKEALKVNLNVRVAESQLRQARASRGVAAAAFWPGVNATGSYTRSKSPGAPAADFWQAGLDAAWELDFFGGIRRNIESADASIVAAVENRRAVLISVAAEVALDYVDLRSFQERIQIAQDNLKAERVSAVLTREKFNGGFASGLDVANADAVVASTQAAIPPLETGERQMIYALSVLLARPPAALKEELSIPGPVPQPPAQVPVGLPSDLLKRRPDVRQTEAQFHAAMAQIGVATSSLYPQFSLTGAVGQESVNLSDITRRGSLFWSYGPSASWTVFDAGRIRSNIELQKGLTEQALLTWQSTVLGAFQDVENALVAFAMEQQHWKELDSAVAANAKAVDLSTQLYAIGNADFLSVVIAESALYSTQDARAQSRQAVITDLIALYKALGGGWENQGE